MSASAVAIRTIRHALSLPPSEKTYVVHGWVQRIRKYRNHAFLDINDGTSTQALQCFAFKADLGAGGHHGSCLKLTGNIVQSPGKNQSTEFKVRRVKILGDCDESYPFGSTGHLPENYYRAYPHLKPRVPFYISMNRLKSELGASIHMIMRQMDFFQVQTPILTSNDSESSGDLFSVYRERAQKSSIDIQEDEGDDRELEIEDECQLSRSCTKYFGKDVFLTCSAQLHLEMMAASLSRVYNISSTFRAENSNTKRHMCEFTMFEAEEAFCYSIEELVDRVETVIKFTMQYLAYLSPYKADLLSILNRLEHEKIFDSMLKEKFVRMTYVEAIRVINENFQDRPGGRISYGHDIGRTHEKYLVEHCGNKPIFIMNYPKRLKPFYMKVNDSTDEAQCFDLIGPVSGELCGGSLREDRLDVLDNNIIEMFKSTGLSSEDDTIKSRLKWYTDLRRYGSFPHGGFGIGVDRLIQSITGMRNIKDVSMFPRWPRHCPL